MPRATPPDPGHDPPLLNRVLPILEGWQLSSAQQIALLGLPSNARRRMLRSLTGDSPLADNPETALRVKHILEIHRLLRLIHPHSRAMADYWVTTPHIYFSNREPLQLMLDRGLAGMQIVLAHLNGSSEW